MADEILVKYKADYSQVEKGAEKVAEEFTKVESTGQNAFNGVSEGANKAAAALKNAQKQIAATKTSFNALGNSVNQISRELPAFAVSTNLGLLAISNNLPALFDGLKSINAANKELAAQGKQTTSAISQLGAAIFSWQTALSVGVTLLTVYGGNLFDLVVEFVKGKKPISEFKATFSALNDAFKDKAVINKAAEFLKLKHDMDLAKAGTIDKDKVLKRYNETVGLVLGTTKSFNVAEQRMIDNKAAYVKSMVDRAAATSLYSKAAELMVQEVEVANKQFTADDLGFFDSNFDSVGQESQMKKRQKEQLKFLQDQQKIYLDAAKKLLGNNEADPDKVATKSNKDELRKKEKERNDLLEIDKKYFEEQFREEAETEKLKKEFRAKRDKERKDYNDAEAKYDKEQSKIKLDRELEAKALLDKLEKDEEEKIKLQKEAKLAAFAEIANGINALAQLAGEETELGKELAIAAATIDTYLAAQRAFTSVIKNDPTGGILAGAAAAAAIVSGLARVQKIISVQVPKKQLSGARAVEAQTFAEGVVDLQGPGTTTSDSIPAWLSRGESVIKASSTAGYKDELKALNTSPLDYEKLLRQKYIEPALEMEKKQTASMVENIARSFALHSAFNDKNIVKELKHTRKDLNASIQQLAELTDKKIRQQRFENRLSKNI